MDSLAKEIEAIVENSTSQYLKEENDEIGIRNIKKSRTSQKQEVRGRKIFSKGAYEPVSD